MGYFRKPCFTKYDKMLNLPLSQWGCQCLAGHPAISVENLVSLIVLHVPDYGK